MPRATAPPAALLGGTAAAMHIQQQPQPVPGGPGDVGAFLAAHALEHYEDAFVAAGYHRLVPGSNRSGVQGAHMNTPGLFWNPLGLFLRTSIPFV